MPPSPSSGQPRLARGSSPSSRPHNRTSTTEHRSSMLATSHEANVRLTHDFMTIPNGGVRSFCNSYSQNTALFRGPQGDLVRAPLQQEIDNAPLVPEAERPQKFQGKLLVHVPVVHTPETHARILRLSKREQAIVFTDGGNTAESQRCVLDTIERYPPDHNNQRVWTEVKTPLPSGKETIKYHCKATGCDYRDVKFQKARQHFVSSHVAEACWGCPIEGCTHIGKYKRLDDLKHHHMVPGHRVEYTRNKNRDTSEHPTDASTAGQAAFDAANPTSPLPEGPAPAVITITAPSQVQDQESSSLHTSSQVERGPKKARKARQKLSAGPSQVGRSRPGRATVPSETTSRHDRDILAGTEASSNMLHQDITSLGVATPANVYPNALSPQSHSQQRPPWSNPSGSPAYVGTLLAENPYSPDALDLAYRQLSHSPLGTLLDDISAYMSQRATSGELAMSTAPQQVSYGNVSMPYAPSPLRGHPDHHGMAPAHRPLTLSPQGGVDVGAPLRGPVTDGSYPPRQDRSNGLVNRVPDDLNFGGRSNFASPSTQLLVPNPHYNQWGQTGSGLPTNFVYNLSSQSPPRTLGALSSDRSNGRHQVLSSGPYAPPQRAAAPNHGFAENGGYLSAQWSDPRSMGFASPTQGTVYHDRNQAPGESTVAYSPRGFDGFETPSADSGWSPHSGYPNTTLSTNLRSNYPYNLYPQSTSDGPNPSTSENSFHFFG